MNWYESVLNVFHFTNVLSFPFTENCAFIDANENIKQMMVKKIFFMPLDLPANIKRNLNFVQTKKRHMGQ